MKVKIRKGYCHSDEAVVKAQQEVFRQHGFEYVVTKKFVNNPGMHGIAFDFEIYGTDSPEEVCELAFLSDDVSVVQRGGKKWPTVRKSLIEYADALSPDDRTHAIVRMFRYLLLAK